MAGPWVAGDRERRPMEWAAHNVPARGNSNYTSLDMVLWVGEVRQSEG